MIGGNAIFIIVPHEIPRHIINNPLMYKMAS